MRSAECGMRSAECGMRSAECGVRNYRLIEIYDTNTLCVILSLFASQESRTCVREEQTFTQPVILSGANN